MNHEQLVLKAVLTARKYNKQLNKEVLLHQVFGKAEMAFKLGAITSSQFLKLNTETLEFLYSICK